MLLHGSSPDGLAPGWGGSSSSCLSWHTSASRCCICSRIRAFRRFRKLSTPVEGNTEVARIRLSCILCGPCARKNERQDNPRRMETHVAKVPIDSLLPRRLLFLKRLRLKFNHLCFGCKARAQSQSFVYTSPCTLWHCLARDL